MNNISIGSAFNTRSRISALTRSDKLALLLQLLTLDTFLVQSLASYYCRRENLMHFLTSDISICVLVCWQIYAVFVAPPILWCIARV